MTSEPRGESEARVLIVSEWMLSGVQRAPVAADLGETQTRKVFDGDPGSSSSDTVVVTMLQTPSQSPCSKPLILPRSDPLTP